VATNLNGSFFGATTRTQTSHPDKPYLPTDSFVSLQVSGQNDDGCSFDSQQE